MPDMTLPTDPLGRAITLFARAWLALAVHVAEEALTDFLSVYNPTVLKIRERLPWVPLPTFSFRVWISGLAALVALLFALGPVAFRGSRWIVVLAVPFSLMMVGNGLGHVGASLYRRRLMPGVYSSPLLVAASLLVPVYALRLL
jgi:hypothetical protein